MEDVPDGGAREGYLGETLSHGARLFVWFIVLLFLIGFALVGGIGHAYWLKITGQTAASTTPPIPTEAPDPNQLPLPIGV